MLHEAAASLVPLSPTALQVLLEHTERLALARGAMQL